MITEEDKPQDVNLQNRLNGRKQKLKKIRSLSDDASRLINLQGKIIVFLEPPGKGVLNLIKPILSHDKLEISYPYAAKNGIVTNG